MKSNVLVVTRNLPPLVGGMERLLWHIVDELRSVYRVYVAGPSGCRQQLPDDVEVTEIPLQPMVFFLIRVQFTAVWLAFRNRPCVILAGSGLTAPFSWLAARITGARCIVYLHGLDIKVRHPFYRLLWLPIFRHFDCVLVNSNFTKQLALDAHIRAGRIEILHPGVELPSLKDAQQKRIDFRTRHDLQDVPLLLSVGRITSRKGLLCFSDKIFPHILLKVPEVTLVIIGDNPTDALVPAEDESVKVKDKLKEKQIESRVLWLGRCSQRELDDAYFAADVLIFPVQQREDDIEGFGMVAIEAAAHGLPTVAFSVGGVTDAVSNDCCGRLIFAGDNPAFVDAVIQQLEKQSTCDRIKVCREFAELFEWDLFGRRLRSIFHKVGIQDKSCANG